MKNKVSVLIIFLLIFVTCCIFTQNNANADQDGDFTYTLSDGKATITKYTGSGGTITIPSILDGYTTVAIGYKAFYYSTELVSITIPNSVISIGYQAFYSCTSLTSVNIGNNVKTIGDNAFYYCNSLTSIIIPDNVTTIGNQTFYYCSSIVSLTFGNNITTIGNNAFAYCTSLINVVLPDSLTSIGYNTFAYCSSLQSVTIGKNVATIEVTTFAYCTSLNFINLGDNLKTIGNSAFAYCSSLVNVTIPDSVKTIGDNTFYYCLSLNNVTIGRSVSIIKKNVFYHCSALTSITFLGLVAPINVESSWILGTPEEIRGHAYVSSNFPAPNNTWNGLIMGTQLEGSGLYENKPPIVDFTWQPSNASPYDVITFDVSWSYDPDGSIILYEWDWNNDGIYEESHTNLITTHSWKQPGNYPILLRITDNSSVNSTKTIIVSIGTGTGTPGFELIFLIYAALISIIILKKKRKT